MQAAQRIEEDPVRKGNSRCSSCKKVKPVREFYVDRGRASGVSWYCIQCKKDKEELKRQQEGDATYLKRKREAVIRSRDNAKGDRKELERQLRAIRDRAMRIVRDNHKREYNDICRSLCSERGLPWRKTR